MSTEMLTQVWADIGGTFTDCLVTTYPNEMPSQATLKVLSSGLVSVDVEQVVSENQLQVRMPGSLVQTGFWVGAMLAARDGKRVGTVVGCECLSTHADVATVSLSLDRLHGLSYTGDAADEARRLTLDAGIEAPVLATRLLLGVPLVESLPRLQVRLGTTRGTNALLTRGGAATVLLITEGFGDLLSIGTQDRPELFALDIVKPEPLPQRVIEIPGRLSADGTELKPIDVEVVRERLQTLWDQSQGSVVLAICLLHSYVNEAHEQIVEQIAREVGFERIVRSTLVALLPRIVPRAETTTLDAYLQPVLEDYVLRVQQQFGGAATAQVRWMTSGGNLVAAGGFRGRESVLSGPAGGVVALATIAQELNLRGAVGLDMGGTSTDVSRYDGEIGRRQESMVGGIRVLAPMMDIHTVAAGGGSICGVRDGRLFVGPASAGADPGPACYGRGGPLTITDINVILKRLPMDRFPFRLYPDAAWQAIGEVHQSLPPEMNLSVKELASGFLQIAVTEMAEAVRVVTTAAGNDVRKMALVGFGGAAGGHLCRVAETLGMTHVIDHPQAGILSAVGIGHAAVGRIVTRAWQGTISPGSQTDETLAVRTSSSTCEQQLREQSEELRQDGLKQLCDEESLSMAAIDNDSLSVSQWADLRYAGTQSTLEMPLEPIATLAVRMDERHASTFGYDRPAMPIEIVSLRCETTIASRSAPSQRMRSGAPTSPGTSTNRREGDFFHREQLAGGDCFSGPAIIASDHSILVVESGWKASVDVNSIIQLHRESNTDDEHQAASNITAADDAIEMEIVSRRVQGIAGAMGEVIRRTSVSVNVKERRDYSCAVFLGDGSLVANAAHVPVHLGAMGHTVRSMIAAFPTMHAGDCYISNDPFAGGSHLPDVTTVTPIFVDADARPRAWPCDYFVASRCHHAEIGGLVPGSMAPAATCLAEEGVLIHNMPLTRDGVSQHAALRQQFLSGPYPTRNVEENMADIAAAEAAGREGARAIRELANSLPPNRLSSLLQRLMSVAGEATATWIDSLGSAERSFADQLDDGTPVAVTLRPHPDTRRLTIDFTGTGGVHTHGFNATRSIVTAAVLYVLRCVTPNELPLCDGVLDRIDLVIPSGLLDPPGYRDADGRPDPQRCPAVVAGNVETSNRVVDVLLGALGVASASQGTMNNLLLGDATFGYYETIGGGAGATAHAAGADAVHTHMTNTRITDPEVLESRLPLRLWRFGIRRGSGGRGRHRGGDGMVREIEFLRPLTLSLITSRRTTQAYGLAGGQPGRSGQQTLIHQNKETRLPGCVSMPVAAGDRLRIETPGGGGFGNDVVPAPPLS